MDKEAHDLPHRYFLMENYELKGMTLQELFDYRYEYLNLREKVQKKFEELDKEKTESNKRPGF